MSTEQTEIEHLKSLSNVAFIVTKRKDVKISIDNNNEVGTAFVDLKTLSIVLSNQILPIGVSCIPRLYKKLLDGELIHELGHILLTLPHIERYMAVIKSKTYPKLAQLIENIIEDKRINFNLVQRYRLDFGLRLQLLLTVMKDSTEKTLEKKDGLVWLERKADLSAYLVGLVVKKGLYDCDISTEFNDLTKKQQTDLTEILTILDKARFQRVTLDLITALNRIYEILASYMKNSGFDKTIGNQTPILNGGSLKTKLNEESKEVKAEIEAEKEEKEAKEAKEKAEKLKEELREKQRKPSDGSEIAAPIPNHLAYSRLVTKNQRLITELLNRLKQIVKPKTQRTIFQKKGRLMSNILAQAYTNSFNRIVENIYVKTESIYEKQKVAIAFLFDSSGSVNKTKLFDCMTVLNEVFGQYLSDSEFSIANFGTNLQRVKTFSETYENTKARIPAVDCGFDNNEMINTLLESYLKQFNGISKEYKKICCIISDFQLLIGKEGFETIINKLIDAKVQPFFIGIDGWQYAINLYMHNDKRVKRVGVSDISQLPNLFLKIYLEGIQGIN